MEQSYYISSDGLTRGRHLSGSNQEKFLDECEMMTMRRQWMLQDEDNEFVIVLRAFAKSGKCRVFQLR